ncbi:hypothetical protein [Endothiovibrio diazotrophicus]
MNPPTLWELNEVPGLFSDALLAEEGRLRFLSVIGLETAIRELQSRRSLPADDPDRLQPFTIGATVVEATGVDSAGAGERRPRLLDRPALIKNRPHPRIPRQMTIR